jgi:hypothetical protein
MKILYVLGMCSVFLTGCYQSVSGVDIERATQVCGSTRAIDYINADVIGNEYVRCKNKAARENLDGVVIKD